MPQSLGEHCQSVGEVRYATVYMDPDTERSNGTGKVDFDSEDTALRAVGELTGSWLDGSQITVQPLAEVAPQLWQRRQNDGRSVFVGGLDSAADDEALREFASTVGDVVFARVFLDRETGRSRGCGKVEFDSAEAAQRAIQELDGQALRGRRVTVELLGQDSGRRPWPRRGEDADGCAVFFGGLGPEADDGSLWSLAARAGGVAFAKVFVDRQTGRSRGCGKVEFESADHAQRAVLELNGREVEGRLITVEPLGQNSGRRPGVGPGPPPVDGRQLFVSGLGAETDLDALRSFCERVGAVTFATLFTDRKTGQPKGSAKVEFETAELARRAAEELDGQELLGSRIAVRVMSQEAAPQAPRPQREPRGPPVVDGRQLFVGGLGPETDVESLRRFCEWVGKTTFATVFVDRDSGQPRGSGKVEFETPEAAERAAEELDGKWLDGHAISARVMSQAAPPARTSPGAQAPRAADGRQVFLSGLGQDADAEALRWFCRPVGEVTFATVFADRATGQPRGTGKVEFRTPEAAQRAAQELDGKPLAGHPVAVRVMDRTERPPRLHDRERCDQADPSCKLFVGSLPPETSDEQLQDLFRQAGEVKFGRIFASPAGGRGLAGQVVMSSREEAQRAIGVLNDTFLMGKRIVVRLDAPPKERTSQQQSYESMVFVGGMSLDTTAEMLQEHFAGVGDILHASVFTDRETGRSRGSGKVEFLSPALARRAVEELNSSELDGRCIRVKPMEARPPPSDSAARPAPRSGDGRQLLIGSLSPDTSTDSLREFCEERIGCVTYATVFVDKDTGEPKGAGKVEFQAPELASRALQELQGTVLNGSAITLRRVGQAPPADGRTVFVRGLSWDASSEDLKAFASQVGEVTFAAVFIDKESGRSKGSGKVQFASPEIAEQAIQELSGAQLYGREVSVRLMTAQPGSPAA